MPQPRVDLADIKLEDVHLTELIRAYIESEYDIQIDDGREDVFCWLHKVNLEMELDGELTIEKSLHSNMVFVSVDEFEVRCEAK